MTLASHGVCAAEPGTAGVDSRLERAAALLLMERANLAELLELAGQMRDRVHGRAISFSKKVFIPLTTLCRDHCGYCTFRKSPGEPGAIFMTPDDVLRLAERGAAAGCKEALFSLGDQPERAYPEAREFLRRQGFERTLEYLGAMSQLVLEKTGLLPHANPGVMARDDLARLKQSNASMGLMLENASARLLRRGGPHADAPDKAPALRLRTIEDAGRLKIAFTTGILIGIGETVEERVDSLIAIRELHQRYGHIQEVIVQNFRAKADIPMALHPEPSLEDLQRTLAVARLLLPADINLQAPPNLSGDAYPRLLEAGINDWGGISPVTKDFINPEAAWPHIAVLRQRTEAAGFVLRERLAIYPQFIGKPGFLHPRVQERVEALGGLHEYAGTFGVAGDATKPKAWFARRPRAGNGQEQI